MQTIEIPFLLLRLWVGGYFIYWGLNGFFGWTAVPANSPQFERFIGRLMTVPALMTVVKVIEIAAGASLVAGVLIGGAILALLPIVFVIVSSHLILNFTLGWRVAMIVLIPYAVLATAVALS